MNLEEIDRLEITVLVDNYTDLMRTDSTPVYRRPTLSYGEVLLAEHGLSLYVTTWSGINKTSFLLDAGGSPVSLIHNAVRLGVDLHTIEAIFISHGHDDHTGALKEVLSHCRLPVPVYIHPGAFLRRRKSISKTSILEMTPPDREDLNKAGVQFHLTPGQTMTCHNKILITGEIMRTTSFEKTNPVYSIEKEDTWIPDTFRDDQAVIMHIRKKGLVILTGCAHAGIVNTIQYAQNITGISHIHAIVGGFHLSGSFFRPVIGETIAEIQKINPTYIIPLHCTGWEAITGFAEVMPGQMILNTVGTTYTFK